MSRRKVTTTTQRTTQQAGAGAQVDSPDSPEDILVDVVEVRDSAKAYFEKNQKIILGALLGALVLFGGYFGYKSLIQAPKQKEALKQMWQAEAMFQKDSFDLALTNPGGGYPGFADIISQYSGTDAANQAKYYAGICSLNMGKFEDAANYLKSYSPSGNVTPIMKYGVLGDAYSEMNNFNDAIDNYTKAVKAAKNEAIVPYYMKKLAMLSEKQGDISTAKKYYTAIKEDYPSSAEAVEVDKYISRVSK